MRFVRLNIAQCECCSINKINQGLELAEKTIKKAKFFMGFLLLCFQDVTSASIRDFAHIYVLV